MHNNFYILLVSRSYNVTVWTNINLNLKY